MPKCKSCGKEIVFAEIVDEMGILTGKTVPLDSVAPVYQVDLSRKIGKPGVMAARRKDSFVSHFATCNDPSRFSKNKKNEKVEQKNQ